MLTFTTSSNEFIESRRGVCIMNRIISLGNSPYIIQLANDNIGTYIYVCLFIVAGVNRSIQLYFPDLC